MLQKFHAYTQCKYVCMCLVYVTILMTESSFKSLNLGTKH